MIKVYKNLFLMLGVTVLLCLSMSYVKAETLVRCKILLPKLLGDISDDTQKINLPVKWYDLIYKLDEQNKKITEDGNDKFEIYHWRETSIFALNQKPKNFDFANVAKFARIDIAKKEVLNAIEFNRVNGKLFYAFFVIIESDLDMKLCKEDGGKKCEKGDFWKIAQYSTIDDFGCEKINKKF